MIPHNSLFKRLINHLEGLNDELLSLRVYYEGEYKKSEASNDFEKQKLCIRMLSQVKSEQNETRAGIYHWKIEEERYFKLKNG